MLPKRLTRLRSKIAVTAVAASTLFIAACNDSTTPIPPSAIIKFVNLSSITADAAIDLRAGNSLIVQGQGFPTASQVRISEALSGQTFSVLRTGDTTKLASSVLTFGNDSSYNLFFIPAMAGGYSMIFTKDTITSSPTVARFQFAHFAFMNDSANVDVFVAPMGTINPTLAQRVASNVAYGTITPNITVPVDTTTLTLIVQRTSDGSLLTKADSLAHTANAAYMLVMGDRANSAQPKIYVVPQS